MALPTKQEEDALEKFRLKVTDVLSTEEIDDDMFLVRWLRARDLNLEEAEVMLRKAKQWRKENNLDSLEIDQIAKPHYREIFPQWMDGVDKEGRPVITVPFGKWDVRELVNDGKSNEYVSYLTQTFEKIMETLKICTMRKREQLKSSADDFKGKDTTAPITQAVVILDWNGFSWSQLFNYQCIQTFLSVNSIYEGYYPEILYRCYFINCPRLISAVLALLRPVLATKTMAKIICFGTNMMEWREEFLKYIEEDQLRHSFGGTREEDD